MLHLTTASSGNRLRRPTFNAGEAIHGLSKWQSCGYHSSVPASPWEGARRSELLHCCRHVCTCTRASITHFSPPNGTCRHSCTAPPQTKPVARPGLANCRQSRPSRPHLGQYYLGLLNGDDVQPSCNLGPHLTGCFAETTVPLVTD